MRKDTLSHLETYPTSLWNHLQTMNHCQKTLFVLDVAVNFFAKKRKMAVVHLYHDFGCLKAFNSSDVFQGLRLLLDILPATGANPQLGGCKRIGFPGAKETQGFSSLRTASLSTTPGICSVWAHKMCLYLLVIKSDVWQICLYNNLLI